LDRKIVISKCRDKYLKLIRLLKICSCYEHGISQWKCLLILIASNPNFYCAKTK